MIIFEKVDMFLYNLIYSDILVIIFRDWINIFDFIIELWIICNMIFCLKKSSHWSRNIR